MFSGMILSVMLNRRIFREEVVSRTSLDEVARALVHIFLSGMGKAVSKA
jgi:hypothetical protein